MSAHKLVFYMTTAAIVLALTVIVPGAYARLSAAGPGCPDCHGQLPAPAGDGLIRQASQLYTDRPEEQGKAWKETVQRYAAGGMTILLLLSSLDALLLFAKYPAAGTAEGAA